MTTLKKRTKGDTAFPPVLTCIAAGEPVNLNAMTVTLEMHAGEELKTPDIVVSDQLTNRGELVPDFAADDVDTIGTWELEVITIDGDGKRATFRGVFLPIVD